MPSELNKYVIDKELQHTDELILCIPPFAFIILLDKISCDPKLLVILLTIFKAKCIKNDILKQVFKFPRGMVVQSVEKSNVCLNEFSKKNENTNCPEGL